MVFFEVLNSFLIYAIKDGFAQCLDDRLLDIGAAYGKCHTA